jgi:hypothetical protein
MSDRKFAIERKCVLLFNRVMAGSQQMFLKRAGWRHYRTGRYSQRGHCVRRSVNLPIVTDLDF